MLLVHKKALVLANKHYDGDVSKINVKPKVNKYLDPHVHAIDTRDSNKE